MASVPLSFLPIPTLVLASAVPHPAKTPMATVTEPMEKQEDGNFNFYKNLLI
jgi:hypothetical protein